MRIRPGKHGRKMVRKVVYGNKGENVLEFLDEGVERLHGCGIDNVNLWRMIELIPV